LHNVDIPENNPQLMAVLVDLPHLVIGIVIGIAIGIGIA